MRSFQILDLFLVSICQSIDLFPMILSQFVQSPLTKLFHSCYQTFVLIELCGCLQSAEKLFYHFCLKNTLSFLPAFKKRNHVKLLHLLSNCTYRFFFKCSAFVITIQPYTWICCFFFPSKNRCKSNSPILPSVILPTFLSAFGLDVHVGLALCDIKLPWFSDIRAPL